MIYTHFVPLLKEMLEIGGQGHWMVIGVHATQTWHRTLQKFVEARGNTVVTLDLFDADADEQLDLNQVVPERLWGAFNTVLDIGSIEHVFDTRACIENYLRMVRIGGHICVHAPVAGYFDHGFHTFAPEALRGAFLENGCDVVYEKFTGGPMAENENTIMWLVARKDEECEEFRCPQQGRWARMYKG